MLASADSERTRLFAVTDAEIKAPSAKRGIEIAKDYIFVYLKEKVPNLPDNLFDLDSFDHDSGLVSTERLTSNSINIWATKLTEPDSSIAGRSWSVELTIGQQADRVQFASRLSCFSRHLDFDFDPAVPRVYRDLTSEGILYGDGIRLSRNPTDIASEDDVAWLVALINSKMRWRNIVVLSSDDRGTCALNPYLLSDKLCGTAHVVRILPNAAFQLSDLIGKFYSVFDQGIRIYRSTSQVDADEPLKHTLFTRGQLARFDLKRLQNTIALDAFRSSVERTVKKQNIPTFVQIRSATAAFRLANIQETEKKQDVTGLKKQLSAALEARQAAEAQARESLDLAVQEENARIAAETERDQEKARALAINARVQALENRLRAFAVDTTTSAKPTTYDEIPNWLQTEFAGRIRLHSRALRGLKDAEYEDIGLVCELLALLATAYVDSKRGVDNAWQIFDFGIRNRGVDMSKSISAERAGEQGDLYFVKNRNRNEFLEWHLKKGASRNPKRDLRIYFFWDEEDAELVVGYLPGHLDNRLT